MNETELDAQIRARVAQHGFTYVGEADSSLSCVYTLGLGSLGFPEIVIVGLQPDAAHNILGRLITKWSTGGYVEGELTDILAFSNGKPGRCCVRKVQTIPNGIVSYKAWTRFYKKPLSELNVVQVLWPDTKNVLPAERGYNARRYRQYVLP